MKMSPNELLAQYKAVLWVDPRFVRPKPPVRRSFFRRLFALLGAR